MRVAVVGAGPVGLAAALLLRRQGLSPVVFERRNGLCQLPQAHVINTRTAEILREVGLFDRLVAEAAPPERIRFVTWSESLAGRRFGRLPYQGDGASAAERRASSPARTVNLGQDRFERVLLTGLHAEDGAVRFGTRVTHASVGDDHAILTVASECGEEQLDFDLVLACDGANSVVREALGIAMEGPPSLARFASAYFRADLSPYLGEDLGPVNFIAGADVRGVIIGFDMERTWAFMCAMAPDAAPELFTPAVMEELVRRAVGDPDLDLELRSVGSWNMSAQVASSFRKGPFLLVGDAAHRFPPTGGLGVNTGIGDAHNLAWKIGMIARGEAGDDLLDTYGSERRPVACRNRDHSVSNAMRMVEVDEAIAASTLAPVDPAVARGPWRTLPDHPIDHGDEAGRRARAVIAQRIADQRSHFDSLALEIGYAYGRTLNQTALGEAGYTPRIEPGALLPHVWIDSGASRLSLHDLIDRKRLTLVYGAAAREWRSAAATSRAAAALVPIELERRLGEVDPERRELLALIFAGAVLVRPDGHVAWVADGPPDAARLASLDTALARFTIPHADGTARNRAAR